MCYDSPNSHENEEINYEKYSRIEDGLCGIVVKVPGYRSRGPVSIPGTTRFSEK
jgi:hypothetical protein